MYTSVYANFTSRKLTSTSSDDDRLRDEPAPCNHGEQIAIFVFFIFVFIVPVFAQLFQYFFAKKGCRRSFVIISFSCYISQFLWFTYIGIMLKCASSIHALFVIAVLAVIVSYAVVLIESLFCEEYEILGDASAPSAIEYVDRLKVSDPKIVCKVCCYHYEGGKKVITSEHEETFPIGKVVMTFKYDDENNNGAVDDDEND